jgi:hypothetical protein
MKKSPFQKVQMYSMPVCVFMNREFPTIRELKGVSLQELGLTSGSAAIRLLYRNTDILMETLDQELADDGHSKGESGPPVSNKASVASLYYASESHPPSEEQKKPLESTPVTVIAQPSTVVPSPTPDPSFVNEESLTQQQDIISEIDADVKIYSPPPDGVSQRSKFW